MVDHFNHVGMENGYLFATYNQLEQYGLTRGKIKAAILEAEALGLVTIEWGQRVGYAKNYCNQFTLTFWASTISKENGQYLYAEPTNNWRKTTEEDVMKLKGKG